MELLMMYNTNSINNIFNILVAYFSKFFKTDAIAVSTLP
jgi:hypothetical protein